MTDSLEFDGWTLDKRYVTVRDGTRLAAQIHHPTTQAQRSTAPLPVVWTMDRYHQATMNADDARRAVEASWLKDLLPSGWQDRLAGLDRAAETSELERTPWLQHVVRSGYVVAFVDARGSGASFGVCEAPFSRKDAEDLHDITEWLASQPWCTGSVGMFGRSYRGALQYLAAAMRPPHLRAIFPEMTLFDLYDFAYPGGVFRGDFAQRWMESVRQLDVEDGAVRMDEDHDGSMLREARAEHRDNRDLAHLFARAPRRDSRDPATGLDVYRELNPAALVSSVRESGVAVYHLAGWRDLWPKDALLWHRNLREGQQRTVIGPWAHSGSSGINLGEEHVRFYDCWLKSSDDGISEQPPLLYYCLGDAEGSGWKRSDTWPPAGQVIERWYLRAGRTGDIDSCNDGALARVPPDELAAEDAYRVDYETTSGKNSRWANGYGALFGYGDMSVGDRRRLTYTSAPLPADIEVTGHPIVRLRARASAPDVDLFVYVTEVSPKGEARYVTEGTIRLSHRAVSTAPYDNLGLPYHRGFESDVAPCAPDSTVDVELDLLPVSYVFRAGSRIRLSIACADRDNMQTPVLTPAPSLSILRSSAEPSWLDLPTMPGGSIAADADEEDE